MNETDLILEETDTERADRLQASVDAVMEGQRLLREHTKDIRLVLLEAGPVPEGTDTIDIARRVVERLHEAEGANLLNRNAVRIQRERAEAAESRVKNAEDLLYAAEREVERLRGELASRTS